MYLPTLVKLWIKKKRKNHWTNLTPSILSTTFAKILLKSYLIEGATLLFFLPIFFFFFCLYVCMFSFAFIRPFVGIHSEQSSINLNRITCQNKDDAFCIDSASGICICSGPFFFLYLHTLAQNELDEQTDIDSTLFYFFLLLLLVTLDFFCYSYPFLTSFVLMIRTKNELTNPIFFFLQLSFSI